MQRTFTTQEVADIIAVRESQLRSWLRRKRLIPPGRNGSGDLQWQKADLRRARRLADEMQRKQTASVR
jgi:DNA-binding transcriptional MerR regulator